MNGQRPSLVSARTGTPTLWLLAALVSALAGLLGLTAAYASAKEIHEFSNSFGAPVADTTLSLTAKSGLAVNETSHNIYIADTSNHRIVEFSAAGAFIRAFGADVGGAGVNVCTTGCLAGTAGTSPGSFEEPTFLAVDKTNGDLYVADSATHLISKFEADGTLVSGWGNSGVAEAANGQLAGKTQTQPFGELAGIAVDSAGTLAVLETSSQLLKFTQAGSFTEELTAPRGSAALGLSLDGEGNYFKANGDLTVQKVAASGASIGQITAEAAQATGLAANPGSGVLYVDFGGAINAYAFNGAGEVINPAGTCVPQEFAGCPATERFGEGALTEGAVLAVDGSSDVVYAVDVGTSSIAVYGVVTLPDVTTSLAEVHSTTTATLNGEVNPAGIPLEECFFEYGETTEYGATAPCEEPDAEEAGTSTSPVPVHADLTDLTPGVTYHYRLVAANANGTNSESGDQEFTTGPSIFSTFTTDVTATEATLNTEINPNGVVTSYRFQYVADPAFQVSGYATAAEVPVDGESIGAGTSPILRSVQLVGLASSTTYHFRVLAVNALGTVSSADRTFNTQFGGLGFELADDRVWEMVSPPGKHGARLVGGGEISLQASADGNGLAYQSYLSTEAEPEGNRILEPSMNLARRQADGSWRSKDITPPNDEVTRLAVGEGSEYKFLNADLSKAIVDPRSGTPLSPEASERTPYLRENTEPPLYTPLVTGKEPFANVPSGTEFGGGEEATGLVRVVAVSPDFHHFGLRARLVPLVEGAPAFGETLYQWSEGRIVPISALPPNEGGAIVTAQSMGSGSGSVAGALSEDGSRVFWSAGDPPTALYLRYNATEAPSAISGDGEDSKCTEPEKACTVRIDVKQTGASGAGTPSPIFQGASADGTAVFFTDSQQLTEDASPDGADLYRCELPAGSVDAGCSGLTDISAPIVGGENAEVQGIAAAVTANGSVIYFVAKGVLDDAPNKLGDVAVPGQPNFYLWQQGEGIRYIATLSEGDKTDWGESASSPVSSSAALTAAVSPSGRYLSFMSQRSLTGYDNRDKSSGEAAQEVFRYDSAIDQLRCVSCHPTEGRPHSAVPSQVYRAFVDPFQLWAGRPVAAAIPEATMTTGLNGGGVSLYRPRAVLNNGRVFFNAIDPLAPADSNGQWDVYQYEPTGVGNCSASSGGASILRSAGGCVSLISSGTANKEAAFFDADETGDNAFFWSPAQLSVLDEDHEVDIYNARVGGIAATRPAKAECLGEACRGATQVPGDLAVASSAFNGAGNVKPAKHCGKGKRRVRRNGKARCVPRKQKRGGGKSRRAHR